MSTPLLGLILPDTGSLSGAWGTAINNSITSLLDSAVAGTTTLSADADVTLTVDNDVANQARQAILLWTASGTVTRNITAPLRSKPYIVINSSSTQSIVLRATGPTTGVIIAAGEKALCVFNTNTNDFIKIATSNSQIKISVTPEQFGALGDGSTNDRVALQAALDSGFDVFLTLGKTYLFSGASLKMTTNNQSISGGGVLRPSGAINGLVVGGEGAVAVTSAGANLIVGKAYTIHTLGTTSQSDWNTIAGTSLVTYAAGDYFVAAVTGAGSGTGSAWLTCSGNELSLTFSSSTQTSSTSTNGYAVFVGNANRVKINKLLLNDAYGGLYVTKVNMISLEWMWGIIRGPGITWYGNSGIAATAPQRSDVFDINWCVLSHGLGQWGFNWDGNCHSLNVKELGLIGGQVNANGSGGGKGIIIQNTSGGIAPAIGRFEHFELDYINNSHAISITTGLDFDITNPYINGTGVFNNGIYVGPSAAAFNGIYVGAAIQNEEVRVTGGKSNGNTGYGIRSDGGSILYAGNTQIVLNTLGDVYGYLYNKSPYQLVDTYYYSYIGSNNAYTVYDSAASATAANSYSQYTRSSKQLGWTIDNVTAYKLTSAYNQSLVPMYIGNAGTNNAVLRMYGSTSGYVGLTVPVVAGSTTYTFPAAPINGYFLQTDSSGNLSWAAGGGGGGGGVTSVGVATPVTNTGTSTAPIIGVNASSSNTANYLVQRDASGNFSAATITGTGFYADANYYLTMLAGNPVLAWSSASTTTYDRTTNQLNFQISNAGVLSLLATAAQVYKPLRIMGSTSGYVGFTVPATAGSTTYTLPNADGSVNQVLSTNGSGTLSWATVSGGGGVSSVGVTSPVVNTGSSSAPVIAVEASATNLGNYIVQRNAAGDFEARYITATGFYADANYFMTISSAIPVLAFDNTDYLSYDRTNNQYNFIIAGNGILSLSATAMQTFKPIRILGSTTGYVGFAAQATAGSTTYTWPSAPINTRFLQTDAAGNLSWALPSTGVTSVGATAGTPISIGGTATAPTVGITQATSSANGYLSSTDWNTFNGKQPAGSYVTSVGAAIGTPITSTGGTTPSIGMTQATSSTNGYLTSTDWNTFNGKQPAGTYVTSVGASGVVNSSGGTTPTISVNAASANTANYLVQRDASGNFTAGTITATQVALGSNNYLGFSGANPIQAWSATSYDIYDRTNNQLNSVISGNGVFVLASTYSQSLKPFVLPQYTVATLPAGIQGASAYVTDALSPTWNSPVTGGGSVVIKVFYNGAAWVAG